MKKPRRLPKIDLNQLPSLTKSRLSAQAKRARAAHAFDKKLINKFLKQLGVTPEELQKRADADFAKAKSESAQRLKQLRALQKSRRKRRKPLLTQIETTFGLRLEPTKATMK
jgi:predicted component of type VI protein secretion system